MNRKYTLQRLEQDVAEFGLTPKQARVYVSALQLGSATVQSIASSAQIERTNAYDAIEVLIGKGLMSATTAGKKRLFLAEPPEALQQILEEKRRTLDQLLPELRSLYNVSESKPRIRYYPGIEGYRGVYEDTLTCKSKLLFGIYSVQDIVDILGRDYVDAMAERRVKAGITLRIIRSREKELGLWPASKAELREVRLAPAGMVFPIVTFVYDNKVIILSSKKETFGLIIESADVAQAHRNYFEALWQISEQLR